MINRCGRQLLASSGAGFFEAVRRGAGVSGAAIVGAVTLLYLLAELGLWTMARVFP
jgi:hypothetical protein